MNQHVSSAQEKLLHAIHVPPGYALRWTGQYESIQQTRQKLSLAIPLTLLLIVVLLWLNTKSMTKSAIVLLAIPFSAVGAIWLLSALG
ncbi:MAG: efflux RND transporter permease subunit [Bryobacteraceae bacterium]